MPEATIRDVARHAEVSVATVSRALNGLDNVSGETRLRIIEAVKVLGYVPHAGARSLSLARSNAVGVVLPDLYGEFFSEVVRGMDREASRRGYVLLLSNLHGGDPRSAEALKTMRGRVDGLVIMAPHLDKGELAAALPGGIPAVLINPQGPVDGFATMRLDNAAGSTAVAEHFVRIGRRRVAHIRGPRENIDAQERAAAFESAARASDCEVIMVDGDFSEESGEAAILKLIDSAQSFDAVFAGNDNMAIGALQALARAGIRVPEEVAIAGFDDIPVARLVGLTTVRVRIAELGERALARLLDVLAGADDCGHELHSPELIVRSTTSAEAGCG
jgi:LacI family transcriptional regulator